MIEKMEENDSIMILDANKLCRICLSEKSLPICLISNDFSVLKMIEKCTNVKVRLEVFYGCNYFRKSHKVATRLLTDLFDIQSILTA